MTTIDLGKTIQAKSDQLNASEIAGSKTIKITKATDKGAADQPVSIFYEGDNGKPWKPCKSMRRVMAHLWGEKVDMTGRRVTLFCDPTVTWGGEEVGGIRISHMSHIDGKKTVPLRASKHKVKKYTILPLEDGAEPVSSKEDLEAAGTAAAEEGMDSYKSWFESLNNEERKLILDSHEAWKELAQGEPENDEPAIQF